MAENKEQSMIIDGIAAAQTVDSSGEILQIKGCDISSLKEGRGVLNWEHQGPPLGEKDKDKRDTPKNAIGKIIYAKKIFDLEDCEDARQKFFFNKLNKIPYIYIKARLFDAAGHEDAKAAAASFRDAVMHKEAPLINFSIEGHTIEKEGNKIMVSFARAVAATHKPCNKAAIATVLHDPVTGEKHEIEGKKKDDTLSNLAEVEKHEIPGRQVLSSVPIDYNPIVNEDPRYLLKMAVDNLREKLEPLQKMAQSTPTPAVSYHETPEFKTWFGNSKIRDKDGKPARAFHMTRNNFDAFKVGTQKQSGPGIWFASQPDRTTTYNAKNDTPGAHVLPVHLRMENPHEIRGGGPEYLQNSQSGLPTDSVYLTPEEVEAARAKGHDGIIRYMQDGSVFEYVVFDPSQVKSAIGNNGQWSLTDHNITKAEQPLAKTLTAGMGGGAPGTLTQGAALQREDLRKKVVTTFLKNQFLGALRDFDPYEHKDFKKFLKSRLPEVDDSFIDYFDEMAQEFKMRKAEEQVRRLEFLTIELKKAGTMQNMGPPGNEAGYQATMFKLGTPTGNTPALDPSTLPSPTPTGEAPYHLNAAEHGHEYNTHPEQHEMIHGLHFNQQDSGQLGQIGVSDSRKVKLPSGKHAILKREIGNGAGITDLPSTAHAEVLYHNAAKHFFGLGQFVPTTAGIKTPNDNPYMPPEWAAPINHSVMEAIPNARHLHDSKAPDGRDAISQQNHNIILQHGQNGDLDKLAIMNSVLGNRDRHSGNFMFSDNQMHLIDHGHSFAYGERPGYGPADPGYLSHYHEAITGHPWRDGWLGVKLHPEAAKWVMGLKPQNLVKFMKGHGVDSALAMHAGHRLASVQRLIQQKGLDTGVWEAYNTPWGQENPTLHQELQTHAMKEQANAQRMASPAGATRV